MSVLQLQNHISQKNNSRNKSAYLGIDRSKPIVFIHVSGPLKTRIPIIRTSIEACTSLRPGDTICHL